MCLRGGQDGEAVLLLLPVVWGRWKLEISFYFSLIYLGNLPGDALFAVKSVSQLNFDAFPP